MPTEQGQALYNLILEKSRSEKAAEAARIDNEAALWADKRYPLLMDEVRKANLGDQVYILHLSSRELDQSEKAKIQALNKVLGIANLMRQAKIQNVRYDSREADDWVVVILVSAIKALFE